MAETVYVPNPGFKEHGELVARASGQKPADERWTVLEIWAFPPPPDAPAPFYAEVVGETKVPGEVRRVRCGWFVSVIDALAWGAFRPGVLFEQLQRQATSWLEAKVRSGGLVPVSSMGNWPKLGARAAPATRALVRDALKSERQRSRGSPKSIAQEAVDLLRALVVAAKHDDEKATAEAIDKADEFLIWLETGNAPGSS